MKRYVFLMAALLSLLCLGPASPLEAAPRLSVQITLYDMEKDAAKPVAVGRARLGPTETQARLCGLSQTAQNAYERDVFYLKRIGQDQTGTVHFRVRHEQIVENRCTAMEIRDYTIRPGDSCELYSDRGQIRAVMKLCAGDR